MSADTGIYIAKFKDGYRISFAQAIENIEYSKKNDNLKEYKKIVNYFFGDSKVFNTKDEAMEGAMELESKIKKDEFYLEYGIVEIDEIDLKLKKKKQENNKKGDDEKKQKDVKSEKKKFF